MAFGDIKGAVFTGNGNSVGTSNALSSTNNPTVAVGDLVVVAFSQQTNLTASSASDNLGNTYSAQNAGTDAGTATGRMFYARVTVGGVLSQITVAASASTNDWSAVGVALEGPVPSSPLSANPSNITTDVTSPFTCPTTGTLATAYQIVIGWGTANYGTTWAATSPNLLAGNAANSTTNKVAVGYQAVTATTAVAPAFTAGSNPTQTVLGTASFLRDANASVGVGGGTSTAVAAGEALQTVSGAGTAAGTSTAVAVGEADVIVTAVGNAEGTSSASATGESITVLSGDGVAAGTSTAAGAGNAVANGEGVAAGTSTAEATSQNTAVVGFRTVLAFAAAGGVEAGATIVEGAGTAAGTSDVQAVGVGISHAAGVAAGTSDAQAAGVGIVHAAGTAAGTSTANATASIITPVGFRTVFAFAGAGGVVAAGLAAAVGTAAGTSTATATGASESLGVGNAEGTSTANAVGQAFSPIAEGVGNAEGTSTANAVGVDGLAITVSPVRRAGGKKRSKQREESLDEYLKRYLRGDEPVAVPPTRKVRIPVTRHVLEKSGFTPIELSKPEWVNFWEREYIPPAEQIEVAKRKVDDEEWLIALM